MVGLIRDTKTVTIAGAGLAGSLCALYLARAGFRVDVFERNSDPRRAPLEGGRSINLALAERGIDALRRLGLHHRVGRIALPMRGRMIHDRDGELDFQAYGQRPREVIYSVHRAQLNRALLDAAERTKRVRLLFNQALETIDFEQGQAEFVDRGSGRRYRRPSFPLIAADGAGSNTRRSIEQHSGQEVIEDLLDHTYRELTIPAATDGAHQLAVDALHIWPRNSYMMIALPNGDGSFTATLFMPRDGDPSFAKLGDVTSARSFFARKFPDALPLLNDFDQEWQDNPLGILGTVRCPQWHAGGDALLLGDAAHAIVPFHGQGMNAAFEDCPVLLDCIKLSKTWADAFAAFQRSRQPNTDAIADMALANYVEMRDAVIDPRYLLQRELERDLERRHPDHFVPRYSMVMFRRLPYAQAMQRGQINGEILDQLTTGIENIKQVDFDRAAALIAARLPALDEEEE